MKKYYARNADGVVAEVIEADQDINNLYHPTFVAELVECDETVKQGWVFDGKSFKEPIATPPDLEKVKQSFKQQIDTAAENERLKYITAGVGQSMTYTEKFNQAADYSKKYAAHANDQKNTPKPNDNDYLLLKAGLGIDGSTLIEVAETVTYAYAIWQQIGAAIEATRLESKAAIENAKTEEEAQAVFTAIKWPTMENQANAATS